MTNIWTRYKQWLKYGLFFVVIPMSLTLFIVYRADGKWFDSRFGKKSQKIIPSTWIAEGNKSVADYAVTIFPANFENKNSLTLTYDLHGLCLLGGRASTIYFERPKTEEIYEVSLSKYGQNCYDGLQTVHIPFQDFGDPEKIKQTTRFRLAFWYQAQYRIEISDASIDSLPKIKNSTIAKKDEMKPTPTLIYEETIKASTKSGTVASIQTETQKPILWQIKSVSSMKETKDKVCGQDDGEFIQQWLKEAAKIGANYVSIETPYDSPTCGDSLEYTLAWVKEARKNNLSVWHRHMPLAFEGIYDVKKSAANDYLSFIAKYIKSNKNLFKEGDIFTPIPEPQNGGIKGVTYCPNEVCQFQDTEQFNAWLRDSILISKKAFTEIGLGDKIRIGFFGFDGFVAWGDNNPDWEGILEDETIKLMGNITIDHYPEIVDDTMENDLNELQQKYPDTPIIIGEWGTISGDNTEEQINTTMKAAMRPGVIGFNYWHMGTGGNEALLNPDLSEKSTYKLVQNFYKNQ